MRVVSWAALLFFAAIAFADPGQGRGRGVVVAVIDSGVDYWHPALGGGIGPGFKVAGGWDFTRNSPFPSDGDGHGTLIAAIIAADGDVPGIAPDATLLAYSIGIFHGPSREDMAKAIRRAVADGADVIAVSVGAAGTPDDVAAQAADEAAAAGVVVVATAGDRFDSVSTPAAARTSIAVGAALPWTEDKFVPDLSTGEGPTHGAVTFKPDVLALASMPLIDLRRRPGTSVYGTATATAIVAGMAALLREQHPDWTPAQIKSALVTTATPVSNDWYKVRTLKRGGGVVNLARAMSAMTFISDPVLMFGVHAKAMGRSVTTRWLTLSNASSAPQHFSATVETPSLVEMKITPAEVIVPPHGTARVKLELFLTYESLPFDVFMKHGGDVVFRGDTELRVPWAFMRGARVTLDTNLEGGWDTLAFGPDGMRRVSFDLNEGTRGELWVRPGRWDFLHIRCDQPRPCVAVTVEDQVIDGLNAVMFDGATATLRVELAATDHRGQLLRDLQHEPYDSTYFAALFFHYANRGVVAGTAAFGTEFFVSPSSKRFAFVGAEGFIDLRAKRAFSVIHEPLAGITEAHTLTRDASSYSHATVGLAIPTKMGIAPVLTINGDGVGIATNMVGPLEGDVELFATEDAEILKQGLYLYNEQVWQTMLHLRDGNFVFSRFDDKPSPAAYRFAPEGRVDLDQGLLRPGVLPGGEIDRWFVRVGWFGSVGERVRSSDDTRWWLHDSYGNLLEQGRIADDEFCCGYTVEPGYRYVARHEQWEGTVELTFGRVGDPARQPALTSLRIVDAVGRLTKTIEPGHAAWLEFSAANYSREKETQIPMRVDATRVRAGQGAVLRELPFVLTGADNGSRTAIGRDPAGEMMRVDLSALADLRGDIDLVIEVEDVSGSRLRWSLPRAFRIESGRRRVARP